MTTKIDLSRELKELYHARTEPAFVDVPELLFLTIDGHGDPNVSPVFRAAVEALYSVSYTLKFALKPQLEWKVMPLEGLWWVPDMEQFSTERKADWDWRLLIVQPELVDDELLAAAVAKATAKRELPAAELLRLERYAEGRAAQILHVGPYAAEGPTIERLHAFIAAQGFERAGLHHEIYLGDPRRAAPEKLKTIVRQPVAPA
jgi:hypothetical protein